MDLVDLLCAKNIVEKLNLKYKIKCQSIREITFKKNQQWNNIKSWHWHELYKDTNSASWMSTQARLGNLGYNSSLSRNRSVPKYCYNLSSWRASKLLISPMFKNPNNYPHKKKKSTCHTPHLQCERFKESPGTWSCLFHWCYYHKPWFNIRLREFCNLCSISHNSKVTNSCIKGLNEMK